MKMACGEAHMKSILAVGELGSMENVYKASFVAMMAGSDFIKTSTGKFNFNMLYRKKKFHSINNLRHSYNSLLSEKGNN